MKFLKKFNESYTKEDYQELVDTLTTEIFDEFNIYQIEGNMNNPRIKYWELIYDHYGNVKFVKINNLNNDLLKKILNELREIKPIVKGRSDIEYEVWFSRDYPHIKPPIYYITIIII